MVLKPVISLLLVFSILQNCEFKYVIQDQVSGDQIDIEKTVPEHIVVTAYKGNTLNVSWDFPTNYNLEKISFNLKYWKRDEGDLGNLIVDNYRLESFETPRFWTLLTELQSDTCYYVKVAASNGDIEGPESERLLGCTYRRAPGKSPVSIMVEGINNSTIKVTWRSPPISGDEEEREEPIEGYKIRIWEDDQIINEDRDVVIPADSTLEGYVNNLELGPMYRLRVLAFSKAGDGKMSKPDHMFRLLPWPSSP